MAGSRYASCQRTAQCRCGPVTRPGRSAQPDELARRHALALAHVDAAQVHGDGEQAQAVVDDHAVALVVERRGEHHHAAVAGAHRRSHPRAKVHPLVNAGQFAVEDAPRAEAVGRRGVHRRAKVARPQRLRRARGKDAVFELDLGLNLFQLLRAGRDKPRRDSQRFRPVVRGMDFDSAAQVDALRRSLVSPEMRSVEAPAGASTSTPASAYHARPRVRERTPACGPAIRPSSRCARWSANANQFRRAGCDHRRRKRDDGFLGMGTHSEMRRSEQEEKTVLLQGRPKSE